MRKYWENFCVVGMGKHANSKIIPALFNANKNIIGIVSSQNKDKIKHYKCFKTIDTALNCLSEDTVFIIATPPEIHYEQINKVLKYGRDVIVEKPSYTKFMDLQKTMKLSNFKKNIILEGFMHRYTLLYKNFISFWSKHSKEVCSIKSKFYIPEIPKNSFRNSYNIASSCLYDMGCYGISLVNDMGLCTNDLKISNITIKDSKINHIELSGKVNNINIKISFGSGRDYQNLVELTKFNKNKVKFFPFFKGIEGKKTIEYYDNTNKKIREIDDHNGFEEMYNVNINQLLINQNLRFKQMGVVTKKLNDIEDQIGTYIKQIN